MQHDKSVAVVVQSVEGREAWPRARDAIEASDIGTSYRRFTHPTGMPLATYYLSTLQYLADSGAELGIRFEDDLGYVNRHILHNVSTWPALELPEFGAGLLLATGGCTASFVERHAYGRFGRDVWLEGYLKCSSAVMFRCADLRIILPEMQRWFADNPGEDRQMDTALSAALEVLGLRIRVHAPSLVDHDFGTPSLLGHTPTELHTSCGTYRPDWKREG